MSNLDTFDQIMASADLERCLQYFSEMPESDRKKHTPRCLQWASDIFLSFGASYGVFKEIEDEITAKVPYYHSTEDLAAQFSVKFDDRSLSCVKAAILACCTFTELKHLSLRGLPDADVAAKIMVARKAAWSDKWCALLLKDYFRTHWLTVLELEKNQICEVPRNTAYWIAMFFYLSDTADVYSTTLSRHANVRNALWAMLEDPTILRMITEPMQMEREEMERQWRSGGLLPPIFVGQAKLEAIKNRSAYWSEMLLKLAADKLIDESRLLEYSFYALASAGEKEARKTHYIPDSTAKFAIKLNQELIKSNQISYATRYTPLIGARHRDVSQYAYAALLKMPDGTLDVAEMCSCIMPSFLNKSKEPAVAALKLLARLAREFPSERTRYGTVLITALEHSSKDIHKKALALIESTGVLEDDKVLAEFLLRIDMLSGLERSTALAIAERYQSTAPDTTLEQLITEDLAQLIARADKVDKSLCDLARVHESIEAFRTNQYLDEAVSLNNLEFPRLDPSKISQPIQNLDDLIYFITRFWSAKFRMLDLCTLLDGISRLCNIRPADFAEKTDVLKQKALEEISNPRSGDFARTIAYTILSWLREPPILYISSTDGTSFMFMVRLCMGVGLRVASGIAAPLLSAPTHHGGWIDPLVLVERLMTYQSLKITPGQRDFIQALLRMAPDHRLEALAAAAACDGEVGEALRFALGDQTPPNIVSPEYWLAAFRAREPNGVSEELRKFIPDHCPDGAIPAVYLFDPEPITVFKNEYYKCLNYGLPNFFAPFVDGKEYEKIEFAPQRFFRGSLIPNPLIYAKYPLYPTVNLHENKNFEGPEFQTYTWLHKLESILALHATWFLQNIDSIGSFWQIDLEWLFDADTSMVANGRYVIAIAMSSKNSELSRLAVDLLISAISECRITATAYGEAMANLLPCEVITLVRWTKGLREAAKTSAQHAAFCWLTASTTLASTSITVSQQIAFMELLVEWQLEHAFTPGPALSEVLAAITGKGKATKLAKTLLQSKGRADCFHLASLQDLESRISRVERWQELRHVT